MIYEIRERTCTSHDNAWHIVQSSYRVKSCVQTSCCDQLPTSQRMETPRTSWNNLHPIPIFCGYIQTTKDWQMLWVSCEEFPPHLWRYCNLATIASGGVQSQCAIASCGAVCNDGFPCIVRNMACWIPHLQPFGGFLKWGVPLNHPC